MAEKKREAVTEIREFGDKKTVVVYTEDNEVYNKLKRTAKKIVFYEMWKYLYPHRVKNVAVDLYFPKNKKDVLKQQILRTKKTVKSKSREKN